MMDLLKLQDMRNVRPAMPKPLSDRSWNALQLPVLSSEGRRCEGVGQGSPVIINPLKLQDMRNMRPAMLSRLLTVAGMHCNCL